MTDDQFTIFTLKCIAIGFACLCIIFASVYLALRARKEEREKERRQLDRFYAANLPPLPSGVVAEYDDNDVSTSMRQRLVAAGYTLDGHTWRKP